MASNRKKVMLPHTMGEEGVALLRRRDDIELAIYPAGIAQAEFLPMLSDVAGIALSGTPYQQEKMDASPAMEVVACIGVGYDGVEVPAVTARANAPVAGQADPGNGKRGGCTRSIRMMALAEAGAARIVRGARGDRHGLPMERPERSC
jgi:D-3-phosphoglycerate dehydrogenase